MAITVFSQPSCRYCDLAKRILDTAGIAYRAVDVSASAEARDEFVTRTNNARTVPQIMIGDRLIGGYEDLCDTMSSGLFQRLAQGTN